MTWTRRFLSVAVSVAVALGALPLVATASQAAGDVPGEVVADAQFQTPASNFSDYVDGEFVGGGLLVAGYNRVWRYLPSGALDPNFTFAPAGWDFDLGTFDYSAGRSSIALGQLPDGSVLVGAKAHPLVRINAQTGEQLPLSITNADQPGFSVDDVRKIVIKRNGNTADVILLQHDTAGTVSPLIKKFVWRNGQLNRDTNFCPYFADRDNGCVADVPPLHAILAAAFTDNGDIVIGGGANTNDLAPGILPSESYRNYSRPYLPPAECRGLVAGGLLRINSNGTVDRDWADCQTVERGFTRLPGYCERDCLRPIEFFEMQNPRPLLNFAGGRGDVVGAVKDIAVRPDGEIVAVGVFDNYDSQRTSGVVRVNGDGTISQTYSFGSAVPSFNSVALFGERVIAVGRVPTTNQRIPSGVVRFNANGRWDRTFMGGYTGNAVTDMPGLYSTGADGSQERGVAYAAIPVPANPSFPSGLLVLGDFDAVKSGSPLQSFPRRSIVLLGDVGEADSILNEDGTVGSAGDAT
ncbi:MAG: delta-60 repeat domain-containing protein, partial [Candidatus Nanopelagicales bacterium]